MNEANGVYVEEYLEGYAGPPAFHKQGSDLWLFRWHQTWWHLGPLVQPLTSEADFTTPVIYTALVHEPRDFPPEDGWTNDVMRDYGAAPAPTVVGPCSCAVQNSHVGIMDPWERGALVLWDYASGATEEPVRETSASRAHVVARTFPDGRRLADHALVVGCVVAAVLALLVYVHTRCPGRTETVTVAPPAGGAPFEIVKVEPLDAKLIKHPPAVAAA